MVANDKSLERGVVRIGEVVLNSVNLVGRLARDVNPIVGASGTMRGFFTLAVDEPRKDGGTNWIKCVIYGSRADTLCNYTSKGDKIAVTGRLHTFEDNGKTEMQVVVENFDFCTARKSWEDLKDGETT